MAKLKTFSGRQVCDILSRYGFSPVRQRGSHIVMQAITDAVTCTVVVPDHKAIKIGTLLSIIRQSGLPREVFE